MKEKRHVWIRCKTRERVRCASAFTLVRGNKKIIIRTLLVVSLERNINVFSPICVTKIGIAEDVGTCAVEVHIVKTQIGSPNRWEGFDYLCTSGNVPISISINNEVCTLVDPEQAKKYSSSD